ncbi:hypothetical protein GCM10023079_56030 [Streptomyces chitinivorans]
MSENWPAQCRARGSGTGHGRSAELVYIPEVWHRSAAGRTGFGYSLPTACWAVRVLEYGAAPVAGAQTIDVDDRSIGGAASTGALCRAQHLQMPVPARGGIGIMRV